MEGLEWLSPERPARGGCFRVRVCMRARLATEPCPDVDGTHDPRLRAFFRLCRTPLRRPCRLLIYQLYQPTATSSVLGFEHPMSLEYPPASLYGKAYCC